jgi:glutamine synthetase
MNLKKILLHYKEKLYKEFNLIPVIGCELEFYINKPCPEIMQADLGIVEEQGKNQFELRLGPTADIPLLLEGIEASKKKIIKVLKKHGAKALFVAKPFDVQPGSALHMHLNFSQDVGGGKFEMISTVLDHAIGGLLYTLPELMIFFAPKKDSYKRYIVKSMTSPKNISWGRNNRTTALRLVSNCVTVARIEHRVAGADVDPLGAMTAILFGAYIGMKEKISPAPPTYGLAFDPQYDLTPLPTTLTEAKKNFTKSKFSDMFTSFV